MPAKPNAASMGLEIIRQWKLPAASVGPTDPTVVALTLNEHIAYPVEYKERD